MKPQDTILALVVQRRKNANMGNAVVPYIMDTSARPMFSLVKQVNDEVLKDDAYSWIPDNQRRIVERLARTSDSAISKRFFHSKDADFLGFDPSANKTAYKSIRQYIDDIVCEAIKLAVDADIPLFHRKDGYTMVYNADQVIVNPFYSRPRFRFYLNEDGSLHYLLNISDRNNYLSLKDAKIIVVSERPAVFILGNRIYRMRDVDYPMISVFLKNHHVAVPAKTVPLYMESFVAKCVENHYVEANGFRILKADNSSCQPLLSVSEDVMGYAFHLTFRYSNEIYGYKSFKKKVQIRPNGSSYDVYTIQRNDAVEEAAANLLVELGLSHRAGSAFDFSEIDSSHLLGNFTSWLNANAEILESNGIEIEHFSFEGTELYLRSVDLEFKVNDKIDWFDVYAVVHFDSFNIPFLLFRDNILTHNDRFILPNGNLFIIPAEWFSSWGELMRSLTDVNVNVDSFRVERTSRPLLKMALQTQESTSAVNGLSSVNHIERQGDLRATLRSYQQEGFQWLANLCQNSLGGILADDMGLGKTLQTISLISHLYATEDVSDGHLPTLIVVPVSLISNWARELTRFAPHLYTVLWTQVRENIVGPSLFRPDVIIISYGRVRTDKYLLEKMKFRLLVADESQTIKNAHSQTYRAVASLQALHRLLLTGTPIENRLSDLWSQMNIVNPHLLGSETSFRQNYEIPICRYANADRSEKLQSLIAPYMLRRTKDRVAKDLPPITEQIVLCDMTDTQRSIYEREKSSCRNELMLAELQRTTGQPESDKSPNLMVVLQSILRLRMIAIDPQMLTEYEDQPDTSGKMNTVMEHLNMAIEENHKVLIFSSFVKDLNILASKLDRENVRYSMLIGETKDRAEQVDSFNADPNCRVFLLSLKAGGTGLNLTEADYVFLLNPWWNPAVEAQAYARAHRIGQQKPVFVYRFISQDTVEEKIVRLQETKKDLAKAFEASDNPFEIFGMDALKKLIIEN